MAQGRLPVSDGVDLRLLDEADARELHGLIEANQSYLARWLPWAAGQTFDDTLDFIRRTRSQANENDGIQAAVVLDDDIVGVCGFAAGVDWGNRSTLIGYWLDEGHQGKGVMTAAVRTLVDRALTAWQLNRVEIRIAPENRRSCGIPERLGFCEEGTLRRAQLVNGRYLDNVVYSMLAADWPEPGSAGVHGLDHVQVAAPVGCEDDARRFYGDLLGLRELEKPEALQGRGGAWFACGSQQLHVGVTDDFVPATKAHPALRVSRAGLGSIAECLTAAGAIVQWDDAIAGVRRFYTADPWGNRIELLATA